MTRRQDGKEEQRGLLLDRGVLRYYPAQNKGFLGHPGAIFLFQRVSTPLTRGEKEMSYATSESTRAAPHHPGSSRDAPSQPSHSVCVDGTRRLAISQNWQVAAFFPVVSACLAC